MMMRATAWWAILLTAATSGTDAKDGMHPLRVSERRQLNDDLIVIASEPEVNAQLRRSYEHSVTTAYFYDSEEEPYYDTSEDSPSSPSPPGGKGKGSKKKSKTKSSKKSSKSLGKGSKKSSRKKRSKQSKSSVKETSSDSK
jgi:hypothetical protein